MASSSQVPMARPCAQVATPPHSPRQGVLKDGKKDQILVNAIRGLVSDVKATVPSTETRTSPSPPQNTNKDQCNPDFAGVRASERPEIKLKKVMEIWDKETSKYKIVDSIEPERDDWSGYVFVVREHIEQKSKKSTTYIDVKSDVLRDILREILKTVRAVSAVEAKPSIEQTILCHFLPELEDKLKNVEDIAGQLQRNDNHLLASSEHLRLLVDHLNRAYAPTAESLHALVQRGEVTYDLLEALFKPECHVYTKCLGSQKSRCVVYDAGEEATRKGVTYFKLECHYLDYDGHELGEVGIELGIVKFRGRKPIHTLDAFPLQYHPDCHRTSQKLVDRGRKFSELVRHQKRERLIQHCRGNAFFMKNGKPQAVTIDSRVAVDARLFREMEPNYHRPSVSDCWEDVFNIHGVSLKEEERRQELERLKSTGQSGDSMTDNDLLICCPTVRCFSFHEKMFLECAVGDLEEVQWSPASFDQLQIPDDTKKTLLALTTSRLCRGSEVVFDDFVKGKGRGLNVLFFGVPGVGKTFTVEATAERYQTPLYSVSTGELIADHGDPWQLDHILDRIFKIAKRLNTILLIDEADVFMENRSSYQSSHNRLVAVFLRKLEYYEGVLFLTTNRLKEFDDAILSRIHLKIKYPELTKDIRRKIWESFLSEARTAQGPALITDDNLRYLESVKMNGREIKNLTSIAQALASAEQTQVTFQHLEKAMRTNDKFVEEFINAGPRDGLYT